MYIIIIGPKLYVALRWLWQIKAIRHSYTWLYWRVIIMLHDNTEITIFFCSSSYSRRAMWLHASMSNNKPEYIATYFCWMREEDWRWATKQSFSVPVCLYTNWVSKNTENSLVAVIQPALRHTGSDNFAGSNSHRYGKSPSNQVCDVMIVIYSVCKLLNFGILIHMIVYNYAENWSILVSAKKKCDRLVDTIL